MTHYEERTARHKRCLSVSVAQEAEVPYLDKPVREHVEQKPPDELRGIKGHGLSGIPVSIVLPEEGDLPVLYADKATIGKGDTVGIASQIPDHRFGTVKRRLAIDHPFPPVEPLQEDFECFLQGRDETGETEPSCIASLFQIEEELPFEEA